MFNIFLYFRMQFCVRNTTIKPIKPYNTNQNYLLMKTQSSTFTKQLSTLKFFAFFVFTILACSSVLSQNTITFDDQGHTDGTSYGNPYTIVNGSETFRFTISGGAPTSHVYRTTESFCGNSGFNHMTAGNSLQTTWTIETLSGNEINLGTIDFDNYFTCFAFTYQLTIEGFKDGASTGTQTFAVSPGFNNVFNSNASFDDVDRIVISATDVGNLGIDDINWTSAAPATTTPTVTTTAASGITATTATLGGNVTDNGGDTVTQRGIVYNTTGTPTTADTTVTIGSGDGSFSDEVTGLTAETQYYVRAYATNSEGTSYGSQETFTTSAPSVALSTNPTLDFDAPNGTNLGPQATDGEANTPIISEIDIQIFDPILQEWLLVMI